MNIFFEFKNGLCMMFFWDFKISQFGIPNRHIDLRNKVNFCIVI